MEEGLELNDQPDKMDGDRLHKKIIRAGKRTYFFDVKSTREKDFYIIITESKKCLSAEGEQFFEKHKVFIYQEDFDCFLEGLTEIIRLQKGGRAHKMPYVFRKADRTKNSDMISEKETPLEEFEEVSVSEYSNVEFEDLGKK